MSAKHKELEKMSSAMQLSVSQTDGIFFKVELHCTKTNSKRHSTVTFPPDSPPSTVADVKLKVEEDFSIPMCVQSLSYEAYPLNDSTSLEEARIRSGDTFLVAYSAEGDCPEITKVVRWLELVREYLRAEDPCLEEPMSSDFEDLIKLGIRDELIENLAFKYLFPWLDSKKYANKLYFVQIGGLDVTMDIYSLLHRHPWDQCMLHLKYVEYGLLRVLWNLSETFQLRRLIMKHGGLQLCMKSLLRQKLQERESIQDKTAVDFHQENSWILVETIGAALGLLCKYVLYISMHVLYKVRLGLSPAIIVGISMDTLLFRRERKGMREEGEGEGARTRKRGKERREGRGMEERKEGRYIMLQQNTPNCGHVKSKHPVHV